MSRRTRRAAKTTGPTATETHGDRRSGAPADTVGKTPRGTANKASTDIANQVSADGVTPSRTRRAAAVLLRLAATAVIAALALVFTLLVLYIHVTAVTPALGVFTGNAFGDVSGLDAAGQTAYFYAPFIVLVIVSTAGVVALLRWMLGMALDLARKTAPKRADLAVPHPTPHAQTIEDGKAAKSGRGVKTRRLRRSNTALLQVARAGWWCLASLAAMCALYAVALYVVPGLGELTHRLLHTTYRLTPQGMAVYWYAPYLLLLAAMLYGTTVAGVVAFTGVRWVSDALARRIRRERAADEAARHNKES